MVQPHADAVHAGVLAAEKLGMAEMHPGELDRRPRPRLDAEPEFRREQDAGAEVYPIRPRMPPARTIVDSEADRGTQIDFRAQLPADAGGGEIRIAGRVDGSID